MSNLDKVFSVIIEDRTWYPGRIVSGSKSGYRRSNPDNEVYFNANIFIDEGKVWFGDIDVSKDLEKLTYFANKSNKTLYVIKEMDGCFDKESISFVEVLKKAVLVIEPE